MSDRDRVSEVEVDRDSVRELEDVSSVRDDEDVEEDEDDEDDELDELSELESSDVSGVTVENSEDSENDEDSDSSVGSVVVFEDIVKEVVRDRSDDEVVEEDVESVRVRNGVSDVVGDVEVSVGSDTVDSSSSSEIEEDDVEVVEDEVDGTVCEGEVGECREDMIVSSGRSEL